MGMGGGFAQPAQNLAMDAFYKHPGIGPQLPSSVQPLPSPEMPMGKIDPPGLYPPSPPQPPQATSGYYSGSMRPPMGYYQAPNRPYGGGKGGGIPPVFAMPMTGYGMGGFGSPFGMSQPSLGGYRGPQPNYNPFQMEALNQGPFGGGQFRRGFGSYNHMAMSGTGPGSQMYGVQNRLPNIYQGPMNQPQFMTQDIVRPSAQEAYEKAQIAAKDARASGMMGRVVLPGEQSFEEFERNYNFRPQQQLQQVPMALGGLGALARSGFFQ